MLPSRKLLTVLAASIALLAFASGAQAQATRTWVSGVGDDANPCSRTAPCKTFAGAISKTAAGGEISVLDPGGFGAVYEVLKAMEDAGRIRRGYFASDVGAAQFALPAALETLRALRDEPAVFSETLERRAALPPRADHTTRFVLRPLTSHARLRVEGAQDRSD